MRIFPGTCQYEKWIFPINTISCLFSKYAHCYLLAETRQNHDNMMTYLRTIAFTVIWMGHWLCRIGGKFLQLAKILNLYSVLNVY